MDQENIRLSKYNDESYIIKDMYLDDKKIYGYKYSYNYYDIDVDKITVYKKSDNEYFIRYHDVNEMSYVPLQLKIKNFSCEIHRLKNYITLMSIESDDKKLFKKLREIWNKIIELTGINNAKDFGKNTINDAADEFIMVDVHVNTSFVESTYGDKLVIAVHSIIDNHLKSELVQHRY